MYDKFDTACAKKKGGFFHLRCRINGSGFDLGIGAMYNWKRGYKVVWAFSRMD